MTALLSLSGGEVAKPRFAQFFHGSLASLTIRPGKMESQKVIACLQACKEGLDISSLESLGQGIKVRKELLRGQRLPRACALGKWGTCRVAQRWCGGKGAGPVGRFVTVTSLGDFRCVPKFLDGALAYHPLTAQGQAWVRYLPEGNGSVSALPGLVGGFVVCFPKEQKQHAGIYFENI